MHLAKMFVVLCSAVAIGGCVVAPAPDPTPVSSPPPLDGTLTIDWSIDGSKDPAQCNRSSADTIEITIQPGSVFEQSCAVFDTAITLAPGSYSASAVLLDASGNPRTTTLPIDPFRILGGDNLDIPIDFPANSFF